MITRGRANSMTTAVNWFVNFWFALYIPTALDKISWGLYIMFGSFCVLAAISSFLFQVETANRSLEEMDSMFDGRTMWAFLDRDLTRIHPSRDVERETRLREVGLQEKEAFMKKGDEGGNIEKV